MNEYDLFFRFRSRFTPYDFIRVGLGLALLLAAVLKTYQLATQALPQTSLSSSRGFLTIIAVFELCFGVWLLVGLYPSKTRLFATLVFVVFGFASLFKAAAGESDCGCFGSVPVDPWHTFALDVVFVVSLCMSRPTHPDMNHFQIRQRMALFFASCLLAITVVLIAISNFDGERITEIGQLLGNGTLVIVEPSNDWLGEPFPLLEHTTIGTELKKGQWLLLFVDADCAKCAELLSSLDHLSDDEQFSASAISVALIDVSENNRNQHRMESGHTEYEYGRLSKEREWFVQTPLIVHLEDGILLNFGHQLWNGLSQTTSR